MITFHDVQVERMQARIGSELGHRELDCDSGCTHLPARFRVATVVRWVAPGIRRLACRHEEHLHAVAWNPNVTSGDLRSTAVGFGARATRDRFLKARAVRRVVRRDYCVVVFRRLVNTLLLGIGSRTHDVDDRRIFRKNNNRHDFSFTSTSCVCGGEHKDV